MPEKTQESWFQLCQLAWYTNQYEKVNGSFNWSSHIGSFVFPTCGGGGGAPVVTLSRRKITFLVAQTVGTTSLPKTEKVTNTGTATLHISSITISGDFAISSNTCGPTLAVGAICKVKVVFKPTQIGTRTGSLTFTDDASNSPQVVPLKGTGQ